MDKDEGEDREFDAEVEKAKSGRGRLRDALSKQNPELAKLYEEQTPAQRAWGKLIGKLMLARSNDDVEAAFEWAKNEMNENIDLTYTQKAVAFFHAIGSLGIDAAHYRMLRRMFIKANVNE